MGVLALARPDDAPQPSRRGPARPQGPAVGALALALFACASPSGDGPEVTALEPNPAAPGALLDVHGRRLGADLQVSGEGSVAVGGRPVPVLAWAPDRLRVRLPEDTPGGATALVVTIRGRPTEAAALEVTGGAAWPRRPRAFPPTPDAGLDADPDGGATDPADAGSTLTAEVVPDPAAGGVALVPRAAPPGEVWLEVRLPPGLDLGGVAFHLAYDGNVLRFREADPAPGERVVAGEVGRGRLAYGRVVEGVAPEPLAVLRFAVVGRGEGRIEIPERNRTLRGRGNQPIPGVPWAGASLRVRGAP